MLEYFITADVVFIFCCWVIIFSEYHDANQEPNIRRMLIWIGVAAAISLTWGIALPFILLFIFGQWFRHLRSKMS